MKKKKILTHGSILRKPMAAATGSAIPAIESAALNIGTAARDADKAIDCWDEEQWADAVMWINNAIAQLESARAKIEAHAALANTAHEPRRGE